MKRLVPAIFLFVVAALAQPLPQFSLGFYDGTGTYYGSYEIPALYMCHAKGFGQNGSWQRISGTTPDTGKGNWRSYGVSWPMPIRISDTLYVYCEGYGDNRSTYGVGCFISIDNGATWSEYSGNPIFNGNVDGYNPGPGEPYVTCDTAAPSTQRFKMYMPNQGSFASTWTGVACSSTGRPTDWQLYRSDRNAVHVVTTPAGYDQNTPYCVVEDDSTWKMFTVAYNTATSHFEVLEYTSSVGDGLSWTRNPDYVSSFPLRGRTTLSASAAAGSQSLMVASGCTFVVGETILYDNGTYLEVNRVRAIDGDTVTLLKPVTADLPSGRTIYSQAFNAAFPQAMYKINGTWYGIGDALGSIGSYTFDFSFFLKGSTPETCTYDWASGWPLDPMQHTTETTGGISVVPIDEGPRYITIDR
jgi:hypothetical protein